MVEVLKAGMFDTIQDMGRMGFQEFGVPVSGVMDRFSAGIANAIIGNDLNAAVIESTASGPKLKFHTKTVICITGAYMNPKLNGELIKNNSPISVISGDILEFGNLVYGFRTYISVLGGFQTENVFQSRSMYINMTSNSRLQKGDVLPIMDANTHVETTRSSIKINTTHFETKDIYAYKGPEFNQLGLKQQDAIFNQKFTISKDSNRMAYQFNERIKNQLAPIITSLVLPGTVQLTPAGELMVLMRDAQTTGGFPRVLQLTESAINCLSQKSIEAGIRIKCINW